MKCGGSQTDTASCCTSFSPCGINEGDCDDHFECQGELMCGIDNCINILPSDNFPSTHDCCFEASCNGNQDNTWDCCKYMFLEIVYFDALNPNNLNHLCGENEGDCDDDLDCVGNLLCGTNNCLNIEPLDNFSSNHDCCYNPLTGKHWLCLK
jgi:hypothetical protein